MPASSRTSDHNPTPEPLSPDREAEIRQGQPGDWLPGPWTIHQTDGTDDKHGHWELIHHQSGTVLATLPAWAGNVALWAADAHDAVPELLAEIERERLNHKAYRIGAEGAKQILAADIQQLLAQRESLQKRVAELEAQATSVRTEVLRNEARSLAERANGMPVTTRGSRRTSLIAASIALDERADAIEGGAR